jgi:hypothetical protein
MISHARLLELVKYDPETGVFTRRKKSTRLHIGDVCGWKNGNGYIRFEIDGGRYHAHRLAWLYVTGEWPVGEIDHINRDKSDNRISNLRPASRSQNSANSPRRSHLKGATFSRGRWRAQICHNYKNRHLGYFATEQAAHEAYLDAARECFGQFARAA